MIRESHAKVEALRTSEVRFRRMFETAKDAILLLDASTGQVRDVNRFLIEMLGYSHEEFLGKKLWDTGPFKNNETLQSAFQELQQKATQFVMKTCPCKRRAAIRSTRSWLAASTA